MIGHARTTLLERVQQFAYDDGSYPFLRRMSRHHRHTYDHSIRVACYSLKLCEAMDYTAAEREIVLRSSLLHDIGKLSVPVCLLDKSEALSSTEWDLIKEHCREGDALLRDWGVSGYVDCDMILYHHENVDGSGYDGIPEARLSLSVKLLRVVDSYDAMTVSRSYNKRRTHEEAFDELYRCSGRYYDPYVVDAFYRVMCSKCC
ncbi:HD-GYP domain-containing protein [Paenibacillus mesophilus]|uniref:HD-GYP domain-containing protein n=1 Tax=Paenibacillus mesophilus TaxID=2582849 RepID=UPI001EE46E1A|nr:HD domain-containing phosphohydrolase [Paenibacillus mesophilus]